VTKELHEMLKIQKDGCIIQENAFHAGFDESFKEGSDVKSIQETEKALSKDKKRQKRSEIQFEIKVSKKATSECPACSMKKHDLSKC